MMTGGPHDVQGQAAVAAATVVGASVAVAVAEEVTEEVAGQSSAVRSVEEVEEDASSSHEAKMRQEIAPSSSTSTPAHETVPQFTMPSASMPMATPTPAAPAPAPAPSTVSAVASLNAAMVVEEDSEAMETGGISPLAIHAPLLPLHAKHEIGASWPQNDIDVEIGHSATISSASNGNRTDDIHINNSSNTSSNNNDEGNDHMDQGAAKSISAIPEQNSCEARPSLDPSTASAARPLQISDTTFGLRGAATMAPPPSPKVEFTEVRIAASPALPVATNEVPPPPQALQSPRRRGICCRTVICATNTCTITFGIIVIFAIILLILVLYFIPTMMVGSIVGCIYYCKTTQSMPIRALTAFMFATNPREGLDFQTLHESHGDRAAAFRSKVIVRKLVRMVDREDSEGCTASQSPSNHDHHYLKYPPPYSRSHLGPVRIMTETKCMDFSRPLAAGKDDPCDQEQKSADKESHANACTYTNAHANACEVEHDPKRLNGHQVTKDAAETTSGNTVVSLTSGSGPTATSTSVLGTPSTRPSTSSTLEYQMEEGLVDQSPAISKASQQQHARESADAIDPTVDTELSQLPTCAAEVDGGVMSNDRIGKSTNESDRPPLSKSNENNTRSTGAAGKIGLTGAFAIVHQEMKGIAFSSAGPQKSVQAGPMGESSSAASIQSSGSARDGIRRNRQLEDDGTTPQDVASMRVLSTSKECNPEHDSDQACDAQTDKGGYASQADHGDDKLNTDCSDRPFHDEEETCGKSGHQHEQHPNERQGSQTSPDEVNVARDGCSCDIANRADDNLNNSTSRNSCSCKIASEDYGSTADNETGNGNGNGNGNEAVGEEEVCARKKEGDGDGNTDEAEDGDDDDDDQSQDRAVVCDICLLEFEEGDLVAWSPNSSCVHSFHAECIADWLVQKPTCPHCRHNYIRDNGEKRLVRPAFHQVLATSFQ